MYRRLSTCFCGEAMWREVEGAAIGGDEVLIEVHSFLLGAADRALLNCIAISSTHRVLGSAGVGRVIDQGPLVEDDIVGRVVVSSPLCRDRVVPIEIDGAAQRYWAIPRECVEVVPPNLVEDQLSVLTKYLAIPRRVIEAAIGRDVLVVGDDPLAIAVIELCRGIASRVATVSKLGPRKPLKGVETLSLSEKRREFDVVFLLTEDPLALRCAARLCRDRGTVFMHYLYRAVVYPLHFRKDAKYVVIEPSSIRRGIEVVQRIRSILSQSIPILYADRFQRVVVPSVILFKTLSRNT